MLAESIPGQMPWEIWTWSMPQQPIEHFFRSKDNIFIKSPELECQCPPNKQCEPEFQIDDGTAIYLRLRGVIKDEDLQPIEKQKKGEDLLRQSRRTLNKRAVGDCCCPPVNFDMPTFITNGKFREYVDRFDKKRDAPKISAYRRDLLEFQED